MTTPWRSGDPLYAPDYVSYAGEAMLSDPCPPGCWHYALPVGGYAFRWTPAAPVLRFLRDGLNVTGWEPDADDLLLSGPGVRT